MSLLEDIRTGRLGLRFQIPTAFEVIDESPTFAMLADRESGLGWAFGHFDLRLDLTPEHESLLKGDIERHARDLFDRCFQQSEPPRHPANVRPRTEDKTWSPVVEVEAADVSGTRALHVVHRLWYEPGREHLMGHLLVPLASGLFEFRIMGKADPTGMREAVLADGILRGARGDPVEALKGVPHSFFDDARHDASFPAHPLSLIRARLRSLRDRGIVTVTAPAPEVRGEVVAETGSFTVTPPPRYIPLSAAEDSIQCSRVAFAGTDGVQLLNVGRLPESAIGSVKTGAKLLTFAKKIAASVPPESTYLHVDGSALPDRLGRPHALVFRSFRSPDGGLQHAQMRWFVDECGGIVMISANTSPCVPAAELADETEQVAASYRIKDEAQRAHRLRVESRSKPWWKFW